MGSVKCLSYQVLLASGMTIAFEMEVQKILFTLFLATTFLACSASFANNCVAVMTAENNTKFEIELIAPTPAFLGHYIDRKYYELWKAKMKGSPTSNMFFNWIGMGQILAIFTSPEVDTSTTAWNEGQEFIYFQPRSGAKLLQFVLSDSDTESTDIHQSYQKFKNSGLIQNEINSQVLTPIYNRWLALKPKDYVRSTAFDQVKNQKEESLSSLMRAWGLPDDFNFYKENRILGFTAPGFSGHTVIVNPLEIERIIFIGTSTKTQAKTESFPIQP